MLLFCLKFDMTVLSLTGIEFYSMQTMTYASN